MFLDKIKLPKMYDSFTQLKCIQESANSALLEHQVALMEKDFTTAQLFLEYVYELRCFCNTFQEKYLLQLYGEQVNPLPKGGALKFFQREHIQITRLLEKHVRRMADYNLGQMNTPMDLVVLFGEYHYLKDLFNHHDARDNGFLYRNLDGVIRNEPKARLLEIITEEQELILSKLESH